MKLHDLRPNVGAHQKGRRVGRGWGSGRGKTSGAGQKGQKARSGGSIPPYFEGGQLPLVRRLPYRRGFTNPHRVEYTVVNLSQLERLAAESVVTIEMLREARLVRKKNLPVKILGRGTLTKPLQVQVNAFSAAAKAAIEAAGGSAVEV